MRKYNKLQKRIERISIITFLRSTLHTIITILTNWVFKARAVGVPEPLIYGVYIMNSTSHSLSCSTRRTHLLQNLIRSHGVSYQPTQSGDELGGESGDACILALIITEFTHFNHRL